MHTGFQVAKRVCICVRARGRARREKSNGCDTFYRHRFSKELKLWMSVRGFGGSASEFAIERELGPG